MSKDEFVEDVVKEMVISLGGDENHSDEEEDHEALIDDDDRQYSTATDINM